MESTNLPLTVSQANQIGFDYFQAGRLAEAIFLQAIAVEPANITALEMLERIADQTGKPQQAIDFFNRAIHHHPGDPLLHFNLGVSLHDQGKLDEALASYRKVLSLDPCHAKAHNRLGMMLQQLDSRVRPYPITEPRSRSAQRR